MKISAEQAYSIFGFFDNIILSKSGTLSIVYKLSNPECYSLDQKGLEKRHNDFFRAFRQMPANTFVHKQDVFLRKPYDYKLISSSFISRAEKRHFDGRQYLDHNCYLSFTIGGLHSLEKAYTANPTAYKEELTKADKEKLNVFLEAVEGAVTILRNIPLTKISALNRTEITQYLFSFVNGFHEDSGLRDINFTDKIEIGSKKGMFFTVCNEKYFPEYVHVLREDDSIEESNSRLYGAMLENLGVHLKCTHVINQIWKFEGNKLLYDLQKRVTTYGQHKEFSADIAHKHKFLTEYLEETTNEKNVLCRSHYSLMILEDNETLLERSMERVKEIFRVNDFQYYIPSYEGIYEIFIGNILGRENRLHNDYFFFTDIKTSLCLNVNYTTFKSDEEGILFTDRIYQVPLKKDIWDAKKKRIPARNAIFVASTGGGKSFTALNQVQQMLEQGYRLIVVEFGKSFYQLTKLYPDVSLHIDYNGTEPLGINPFFCQGEPDNDKIRTLVQLVLKFLRSNEIQNDTPQIISLTKIISYYYKKVDKAHSFPSFYQFVKDNQKEIFSALEIQEKYFDIDMFLHNGSDFIKGGFYENVCKPSSIEDDIRGKNLIVFELTRIKKDPFLVSVIMSILFDVIENKILSDRSTRGVLLYDEYAETQALRDMFTGEDIHSTVAFSYQKLRKENGAIMTIIQTPSQLPDNNYTRGMIGNTQILYVFPTTETVYDEVIEAFHIKNESHINLMRSIRNDFSSSRPYSELFTRFLDHEAIVMRLEASREKYLAFQTEGEVWSLIEKKYKETGNMESAIEEYIKNQS